MGKYMVGTQLLVIGMGTVLLSLVLLSIFLRVTGNLFGPKKEKKATNKGAKTNKAKSTKETIVKSQESKVSNKNHAKKMAAISAAVYQFLDSDKNYRIISIRKNDKNWKR